MKRSALIIAFNTYHDEKISSLKYSENDGRRMFALLEERMGFETECLIGDQVEEEQIVKEIKRITEKLGPEDLFVLFYAGHGLEHENQHWLLLPKTDLDRLRYYKNMVSINELKDLSEGSGCNRLFILDACRNNLLAGNRGNQNFFFQNRGIREVIRTQRKSRVKGSLGILCSCDEGQVAKELPSCKQGVFTAALVEEFRQCLSNNTGIKIDLNLCTRLQTRMSKLSSSFSEDQRPWLQCSGELPLLYETNTGIASDSFHHELDSIFEPNQLKKSQNITVSIAQGISEKTKSFLLKFKPKLKSIKDALPNFKKLGLFAIGGFFLLISIVGSIKLKDNFSSKHIPGFIFFLGISAVCFWSSRQILLNKTDNRFSLTRVEGFAVKTLIITFIAVAFVRIVF